MSRPVLSRPSDRATVRRGLPPISAALIPRLHKVIPEPVSDPYGSMTRMLLLLTVRLPESGEGDPIAPSMGHLLC